MSPESEGTFSMRSCHSLDAIEVIFDDQRLVADAGLVLPATLAQHLGLRELFDSHIDLRDAPGRANVGVKAMTLVHSVLAGGDSIDDADALRAGATGAVLGHPVRAPSTLGTFLRSFTWGHCRQLDKVAGELLGRAWQAGAGPGDLPVTIDVDSTICERTGWPNKAGRSSPTPTCAAITRWSPRWPAPATWFIAGCVAATPHAGRGAASFLTETFNRVRAAGATGALTLRADSGFYNLKVIDACRKADVRFSVSAKHYKAMRTVIAAIHEQAWTPIPYFADGADVAETSYRPFNTKQPLVRLIVRRVRPTPGSQLALFVDYSYHGFITDRTGTTIELEADHRRHAVIEDTIRDLKYGVGLNHLPSGRFAANAAWLGLNNLAHNLARWTTRLGLNETIIATDTLRRHHLRLPGRITHSARRYTLHLPTRWPWREQFNTSLAQLRTIIMTT